MIEGDIRRELNAGSFNEGAVEGCGAGDVSSFVVRKAQAADSEALAILADIAGGETLAFIARGIDPTADARAIYRKMIATATGLFSYQNCFAAESNGKLVGLANAFPARAIENEQRHTKPTAREEYLEARTRLNDPRSYLLNNIAVDPAWRRKGVGIRLVEAVIAEAKLQGFRSITLHVWADNARAIAFYRALGFRSVRRAKIPWHPELPHVGGSLLFRLNL
ncbi:GCN5-related N-acetyltransferase [Afipia carboxidovorans OM5]|nr:GNAT family N-acetyltransferase [Afipia carboxidovorans]ACI94725.1 GCN5-related N-acetyltransferase [Afipia carboxidovorans OM5]